MEKLNAERPRAPAMLGGRRWAGERAGYLDAITRLLWPGPAQASVGRASSERFADPAREFIVLPRRSDPRLVIPSERAVAAAAVRRYGVPDRRTSDLRKWALWLAAVTGAASSVFPDRLLVYEPRGSDTISSYLQDVLGRELWLSMYVSGARANRKPVLQLLTPEGGAVGFAKIGVDPLTRRLVTTEHDGLLRLASAGLRSLMVPRVLHRGQWRGLEVVVLSPLPLGLHARRVSGSQLRAAMREVAASAGLVREPLQSASYRDSLLERLALAPEGPERVELEQALGALMESVGETMLSYGAWHGDWSPWNMARARGRLMVWDWERFSTGVPLGFDALHLWLRLEVARRHKPARAAAELINEAAALLRPLGVGSSEARLTALLYLCERSVRDLADRQEAAGAWLGSPRQWLIPAIASGVQTLAPRSSPTG